MDRTTVKIEENTKESIGIEESIQVDEQVYDRETFGDLQHIEELITFFKWKKGEFHKFETDRLVFGKFVNNSSIIKILKPTWLSEDSLKKSNECFKKIKSTSISELNPKSEVKFDFTQQLKSYLESSVDTLGLFIVDNYDKDHNMNVITYKSDKEYVISPIATPKDWKEQRELTTKLTGYTIMSKIVFPIKENKNGKNTLWGVAFLESSKPKLNESFTGKDYKFFYMLIKRYGSLLIELDELQHQNKEYREILDSKYSLKTLSLNSSLLSGILIFCIFAWYNFDLHLIHPAFSIPILAASLGFAFISIRQRRVKLKSDKSH